QYHNVGICQEVWRYIVNQTIGYSGADLTILLDTGTRPQVTYVPSVLNPANAPNRLTAQTEWTISTETFLKVQKKYGRFDVDLFASAKNTKVSKYYKNNSEDQEGEIDGNNNNSILGISSMVSRPMQTVNKTAEHATSISNSTRSKKRKISSPEKQIVENDSLEHQRNTLKNQGLADTAIKIIMSDARNAKRNKLYGLIQQKFMNWREKMGLTGKICSSEIVNYLAEKIAKDKLSASTIKTYKSEITRTPCYLSFFNAIQDLTVIDYAKPKFDITPAINQIRTWGITENLNLRQLTTKLCWLLSICGFLRSSDIHRIDDSQTTITDELVRFVIIGPKEKRKGSAIIKPCEIKRHTDIILCPVHTYKVYRARVGPIECKQKHPYLQSTNREMLLRHINDFSKPLSVDSITRYIHILSELIERPPNSRIPKTRVLGASMAANAGVSPNDIVTHAFWSNYYMFDTYYVPPTHTNNSQCSKFDDIQTQHLKTFESFLESNLRQTLLLNSKQKLQNYLNIYSAKLSGAATNKVRNSPGSNQRPPGARLPEESKDYNVKLFF
ncbi:hypothetical protein BB560_003381, partial [Smittium megazygosporum]